MYRHLVREGPMRPMHAKCGISPYTLYTKFRVQYVRKQKTSGSDTETQESVYFCPTVCVV